MPCRDDWGAPSSVSETRHGMTIADFEAAMCGLFTAMESTVQGDNMLPLWLGSVDWKEAGVPRKRVETWWKRHKEEDEKRRAKEAAEKRKKELRKTALGKLTAEELEVLGIRL